MASLHPSITFETDLIWDALATAVVITERLRTRHGDRFRQLERRIEAFAFGPGAWAPGDHFEIEGGHYILAAPSEIMAIIAEARRLGVITYGEG